MSELFLKIVNMSISASWLVLVVLLLRLILKKVPKWVNVLLWSIVAVRLICPVSVESALSLIPSAETFPEKVISGPSFDVQTGIAPVDNRINDYLGDRYFEGVTVPANNGSNVMTVLTILWVIGILLLVAYSIISYRRLQRSIDTAVPYKDNIYQSENVSSPFVLGIIKPRIYLPFNMNAQDLEHVIAHERSHIRRKDHWWKPLGFLLLTIHWFNPLMWVAYILLCRDIELACDEKVIRELDNEQRADYTQALVACSANRLHVAACPLAFGEVGVKERVKSVMNYRKPAFWVVAVAIIICIVVAVCFLTNPKDPSTGARPNIHSHTYVVSEVTYESGMYSFTVTAGENSPVYAITDDMRLTSQKEHTEEGVWAQLGQLEEVELTKENFDDLIFTGRWFGKESATSVRKNTAKAWQLIYNQEILYYVLQQKNGDLYLAYGYYDYSEKDDPYSDDTSIRWLYKLAIDANGTSGDSFNGTVSSVGGADGPNATYSEVKLTEMVSDLQESSYRVSVNLPGTDISSPDSILAGKIEQEWKSFDSMTQLQKAASSHLWGIIYINTDTWKECEQAIGISIYNPLENIDWITKTGYFGSESADPSIPVSHVQATADATLENDRKLSRIDIQSGYNYNGVKITINAAVCAESGVLTTGHVYHGSVTFDSENSMTGSGVPVVVVTNNPENNSGYDNDRFFDQIAYWVDDNVFYTLRVFGSAENQTEIQNTLERLINSI